MTQRRWIVLAGLLATVPGPVLARGPVVTLPVDQVKAGQKGFGLSVFSGFKVERFDVEVIDVLKGFLPKQDIILMRGDHAVLRRAGVLGGMSGSPIYIDGKLVGALAYGWRFSKEPIFGVTPIRNMRDMLKLKLRGPGQAGQLRLGPSRPGQSRAGRARTQRLLAHLADRSDPWTKLFFPRKRRLPTSSLLRRASVPLQVAGMGPEGMRSLKEAFSSFGFDPVQGGGSGKATGPKKFEVGGAIGVQMVSGDISMSGTGTVTHIEGNKVLGFGHSMFNAGEIYLPVVSARINHSHANLSRSFKLSSPARVLGALVQDRQAAILADVGRRVATMPMTLTIRNKAQKKTYHLQLARHRFLTPSLVNSVIRSAIGEALPDVAGAGFSITTRLEIKGHEPLVIRDQSYSAGGLRLGGVTFSRGLRAIRLVATNPFARAELQRIDVAIDVEFGKRPIALVKLSSDGSLVRAGSTTTLTATFRSYGGKLFQKRYKLQIPRELAGSMVRVELAGGRWVRPDVATPETLEQLLAAIKKGYPGHSVVMSLYTPTASIAVAGRVLKNLPPSVMDALRSGSTPQLLRRLKSKQRQVIATKQLVIGRKSVRLRVKSEVE